MTSTDSFDLRNLPPGFFDDPYPTYAALREAEPVKRMPDGSLFLTRHADLSAVYRDAATFSSAKFVEFAPKYGEGSPLYTHHTTSLVFNDAPAHTRVRKLIMGALTRRAVEHMESGLVRLVEGLLDRIEVRGGGDLVEDFAAAIPVDVIGNLLGVPHPDRGPLRAWSLAILGALEPALTSVQLQAGHDAVRDFRAYLVQLVKERQQHPGDPEHDVLTRLIQGQSGADGSIELLAEEELLQNCIFILNAGHETTTNLIANALVTLAGRPDAREQMLFISQHPSKQMLGQRDINASKISAEAHLEPKNAALDTAVDEFLRFESSNQLGNRRAVNDFELGGKRFEAGTLLTLCIGAANRDPAVFDAPNELCLDRQPNRHLAFGLGIHQCAGLSLARLEGRIAISRFVSRFPNFHLAESPHRSHRVRFRGFVKAGFLC